MAKRDFVLEIIEKKARLKKRTGRWNQVMARIINLIHIKQFIRNKKDYKIPARSELAKYVPIGYAACIEGYFKLVYRDLIDAGAPFHNNVANFKDVAINIDHVIAMQNGEITFGEYVSHLLPGNNLDKIDYVMTTILGLPFLDNVKSIRVDYFGDKNPVSLNDIEMDDRVVNDVRTLFTQRHIFAHELNSKHTFNINNLMRISSASVYLLEATEAIVENAIMART